jgi:hypothetical protein
MHIIEAIIYVDNLLLLKTACDADTVLELMG